MTGIPTSMGAHKLELVKGDRNSIVDYVGILDATEGTLAKGAIAGRVFSVLSGKLVPGLAAATSVPYYSWSGLDSGNLPDVTRDRGMPYNAVVRWLVWGYKTAGEMSTTEFATDTYVEGEPLTAVKDDATDQAQRGIIRHQNAVTDTVVGYVSPRGVVTSPDGYSTLYFYPDFVVGSTQANSI